MPPKDAGKPSEALSSASLFDQAIRAVALLPVVGAMAYGVGWVFYAYMFAEVRLTPEDVGITPAMITIRATLLIVVSVAVAGFVFLAFDFARAIEDARQNRMRRILGSLASLSAGLGIGVIFATHYLMENSSTLDDYAGFLSIISGVLLALFSFVLLARSIGFNLGANMISRHLSVPYALTSLVVLGACAMIITASVGRYYGRELADGRVVRLPGYTAQAACVFTIPDGASLTQTTTSSSTTVPPAPPVVALESPVSGIVLGSTADFLVLVSAGPEHPVVRIPLAKVAEITKCP